MPDEKIPFVLIPIRHMPRLGRRLQPLGRTLAKMNPTLSSALSKLKLDIEVEAYAIGSLFSSFFYGMLFFAISAFVLTIRNVPAAEAAASGPPPIQLAMLIGLSFWMLFLGLHMIYPGIIVRKIAMKENKDLLFALREMMIDVDGGVPLFDAIKNVSLADYGYVSSDLSWAVRQIESGVSERNALRELALHTESEYMKRSLWQLVNTLETGASVSGALSGIVQSVENYIYRDIKNYSSNLNFLMLMYMLGATVAPSLGITFMVLLSAFSGLGVTTETIAMLIGGSAIFQLILMGYMSSTRPEIFGG